MVNWGVRVGGVASPSEIVSFATNAEKAGFNHIFMNDSSIAWRDPYVCMALCAMSLKKSKVGLAVTNPLSRQPAVTARAISTVNEVSSRGATLIIGTGDSAVRLLGISPSTYSFLRKATKDIIDLLDGKEVTFGGRGMKLREPSRAMVLIAGSGPKALEMAGEIADGAMIMKGVAPESIKEGLESIKIGAERSGRSLKDLYVIVNVGAEVDQNGKKAVDLMRPFGTGMMLRKSNPEKILEIENALYPDLAHAEDWNKAIQLCGFVPDSVIEQNYLVGPSSTWRKRVQAVVDLGVNEIFVRHHYSYTFPEGAVKEFAKEVIPYVK